MVSVLFISEVSFCLRKAFLNSFYAPAFKKESKKCGEGKILHKKLVPFLVPNAIYEVPCEYMSGPLTIRGRADAVSDDSVYEIKFVSSFNTPALPSYFIQVAAYSKLLLKSRAFLILCRKDSLQKTPSPEKLIYRVYSADIEKYWKKFAERVSILRNCFEEQKIPDASSPEYSWECRDCHWKLICSRISPAPLQRD